jgi:hypothetical protein
MKADYRDIDYLTWQYLDQENKVSKPNSFSELKTHLGVALYKGISNLKALDRWEEVLDIDLVNDVVAIPLIKVACRSGLRVRTWSPPPPLHLFPARI